VAFRAGRRQFLNQPTKTVFHPLLTKTAHGCINAALITLLSSCLTSLTAHATLPSEPPKGVSVLNSNGRALRTGILSNCNVDMISLLPDWDSLESTEGNYDWADHIDSDLDTINPYGKAVLLRINTMGGCAPTGNTPPWVFTAMGQPDCATVTPGVTYGFFDNHDQIWRVIPVFWDPTYLAKKKALIAMAGAHITANPQFSSQVQVVAISYANAITEDWNVPHDNSGPPPTEVDLWLNDPVNGNPPGAGYTTQKMIDAAIHQADATFTDGVVSGTTLTSASAVFTQADVTHQILGRGFHNGTTITAWISPTQVTLSRRAKRNANSFTIVGRRDGLIDVAMAAFPNQYITTAENSNGPDLDSGCIGYDTGICLAETVNQMAWGLYGNRYIVQRNNVTAIIPTRDVATDAWVILAAAADAGRPTAGQALSNCFNDTTYQMNGGDNCNHEDPDCAPWTPPCTDPCIISYQQELDFSGDHLATYNASYYEVYYLDAGAANLSLAHLHCLFNPSVNCGSCSP
jgi:hypothetical protein